MFEETRLNSVNSYGFSGGPKIVVKIKEYPNGRETRNREWAYARWEYRAPYDKITVDHYEELYGAFLAVGGPHVGFRFKDHNDYRVVNGVLGTAIAGAQTMQLVKLYQFGSRVYTRKIFKPVNGTHQLYANGAPIASTLSTTTGIASFTASAGEIITADFQFDVPVRFDQEYLPWSHEEFQALSADIRLLELKELNLVLV